MYLRRSVPWRTAGFVTTCLTLWRVELVTRKGENNNDGVTVVSRHASGGPCELELQGSWCGYKENFVLAPKIEVGRA